ncbi:glycosyltransferase family 39 protein [bacterium]|nr:glycosyltransferase family 39 protein [bacterium]
MINFKNVLKNFSDEQKMFFVFLLINIILFSAVGMIRLVLPTDSLEGIYWGSLHDFGTPKHPPFAGWITYIVYSIFKSDFSIYLLCQTTITVGAFYVYKLAKFFLNDTLSMLSVILLEGCWAYTYVTSYYGFNPDVVLLCILPIITYYCYRAVVENKFSDWIKLGIIIGIAFLNKYQTALVVLPLLIWAVMFHREIFKSKRFYMSIAIAFVIFLPHLLWLIKYDFFPLLYFEEELSSDSWLAHITAPLKFLVVQLSAIAGSLAIFTLLKLKQKSKYALNFKLNEKTWFILLVGLFPFIIHMIMGFCAGGTMRPRWGFEFLYMTGIMLFYFIPVKEISKEDFKFVLKLSYAAVFIIFTVMTILFGVEKNYRSRYPVTQIYNDLTKAWTEKYNTPLKYIGGYIEWTLPLTIYSSTHPDCILDTNGYPNPWIDEQDLKKSGLIIMDRHLWELEEHFKKACPYLDENYKIEPVEYKFTVKNALNQQREYSIYYAIIPPMKH